MRLIISTFIGLYTSRVVLLQLGVEDFGLYAVVGGVVSMMNFLSSSLTSTTYRFIAVELGKGNRDNVNKIFNSSVIIFFLLALLMVLIGETIGVWYINNHLNQPDLLHEETESSLSTEEEKQALNLQINSM